MANATRCPELDAGRHRAYYRDNRVHYFLTHADEVVAVGGVAAVFSAGDDEETNITTDGGQFKTLSAEYLARPAVLP